MNFWDHLDELLSRLRIIIIAIVVSGMLIGFWPVDPRGFLDPTGVYRPVISVIMQRMRSDLLPSDATLIAGGLTDTIWVYMYLSFLIGIIVSSPIIGYELAAFIGPALYPHEKRHVKTFISAFIVTFAFGVALAYFMILPLTFRVLIWFIKSGGAAPFINIQDFYSVIIGLMLVCGLFYTAPVMVMLVAQAGILPAKYLAEFNVGKRRTMYLALLLILTISPIPPDPTPISSVIMLIPFIVIFEVARFLFLRSVRETH